MVPETNTEACERAHMSIIMFLNQSAFIDSGLKNDGEKPQWLSTFILFKSFKLQTRSGKVWT